MAALLQTVPGGARHREAPCQAQTDFFAHNAAVDSPSSRMCPCALSCHLGAGSAHARAPSPHLSWVLCRCDPAPRAMVDVDRARRAMEKKLDSRNGSSSTMIGQRSDRAGSARRLALPATPWFPRPFASHYFLVLRSALHPVGESSLWEREVASGADHPPPAAALARPAAQLATATTLAQHPVPLIYKAHAGCPTPPCQAPLQPGAPSGSPGVGRRTRPIPSGAPVTHPLQPASPSPLPRCLDHPPHHCCHCESCRLFPLAYTWHAPEAVGEVPGLAEAKAPRAAYSQARPQPSGHSSAVPLALAFDRTSARFPHVKIPPDSPSFDSTSPSLESTVGFHPTRPPNPTLAATGPGLISPTISRDACSPHLQKP